MMFYFVESHRHIDHFSPGKIIKATISKVFEETVECEVEFGVKAEAPIEHTEGGKSASYLQVIETTCMNKLLNVNMCNLL